MACANMFVKNDFKCYMNTLNVNNLTYENISSSTVESTDPYTGALTVQGGVGIRKRLNAEETRIWATTQATNTETGSLIVDGGASFAKQVHVADNSYFGGDVIIFSTTTSSDTQTGSLICGGGLGIAKSIYCNILYSKIGIDAPQYTLTDNNISDDGYFDFYKFNAPDSGNQGFRFIRRSDDGSGVPVGISATGLLSSNLDGNISIISNGSTYIINPTEGTDTQTGSLVCFGGVGIAKDVYIGGNLTVLGAINGSIGFTDLNITSTTNASDTQTGALICAGGASIAKKLYIGSDLNVSGNINGNIAFTTINIPGTTDSSDTQTGALICDGGMGIAKKSYLNDVHVVSSINYSSTVNTYIECAQIDLLGGGTFNNIVIGNGTHYRFNIDTDNTRISGIIAGLNGRLIYVNFFSSSALTVILENNSANSTDINRIISATNNNISFSLPLASMKLYYCTINNRWLMFDNQL